MGPTGPWFVKAWAQLFSTATSSRVSTRSVNDALQLSREGDNEQMSTIRSTDGGVASGHPLAAAAGVRALADGGTAVDAALAAGFTQWVVSAPLCGAGGDLVALVVDGGSVTVYAGWARVPLQLDPTVEIVASGPRTAVVPATLRGAEAMWKAGGRLPWARLFEDGVAAAKGHEVTPFMGKVYAECERKGHGHTPGRVNDQPGVPVTGATISASRLSATLSTIADGGAEAFYSGPIREAIVEAARADGAWLSDADLDGVEAFVGAADRVISATSNCSTPVGRRRRSSPQSCWQPSNRELDPAGFDFADRLAAMIEERLIRRCVSGYAGTAVSVAADGEGRSVALVHSLAGTQYGTGWVAGETGVALGNRVGTALSTRPDYRQLTRFREPWSRTRSAVPTFVVAASNSPSPHPAAIARCSGCHRPSSVSAGVAPLMRSPPVLVGSSAPKTSDSVFPRGSASPGTSTVSSASNRSSVTT